MTQTLCDACGSKIKDRGDIFHLGTYDYTRPNGYSAATYVGPRIDNIGDICPPCLDKLRRIFKNQCWEREL